MAIVTLTEEQKASIRSELSAEQASHLIYKACDDTFYFGSPDDIRGWIKDVLCVETFFGAMCDGGITSWFDWDHGRLAHCVPSALKAVGLADFASIAERALNTHLPPPYPDTVNSWDPLLEKIRDAQLDEDFESVYAPIEADFFALYHSNPERFRNSLHAYILEHLDDL